MPDRLTAVDTYIAGRIGRLVAAGYGPVEARDAYRSSLYWLELESPRVAARLLAALDAIPEPVDGV